MIEILAIICATIAMSRVAEAARGEAREMGLHHLCRFLPQPVYSHPVLEHHDRSGTGVFDDGSGQEDVLLIGQLPLRSSNVSQVMKPEECHLPLSAFPDRRPGGYIHTTALFVVIH